MFSKVMYNGYNLQNRRIWCFCILEKLYHFNIHKKLIKSISNYILLPFGAVVVDVISNNKIKIFNYNLLFLWECSYSLFKIRFHRCSPYFLFEIKSLAHFKKCSKMFLNTSLKKFEEIESNQTTFYYKQISKVNIDWILETLSFNRL